MKKQMSPDVAFFFKHAGFGYNPKTETREQGRRRGAVELAAAESVFLNAVKLADVGIEWRHDGEAAQDGEDFDTCESAIIWHRKDSGDIEYLASLGGIIDITADYRRVIRAELAQECAQALQAIIDEARAAQNA